MRPTRKKCHYPTNFKNTEDINNNFFTQNPEQPNKGDNAISHKNEHNSNESVFIKPKKFTKAERQNDFYSKNPFNNLYNEDSPDKSDENDITHAENQIQEKRERQWKKNRKKTK